MGRLFVITLEGDVYCCKHCRTHLAFSEDILSKSFYCKYGKAYLFDNVVNVTVGEEEERMMTTGFHTVVDIFCVGCGLIVGWRYEFAEAKEEKYKEGKYIIERFKVLGPDGTPHPMLSPEPDNVETDDDDDDDEDDDDEDDDDDDDEDD